MEKFQPTILIKIINFYNPKNITRLRDMFIADRIHEENLPITTDNEKGILSFYNSELNDLEEVKFENKLDSLLWDLTTELKEEVLQSYIQLPIKERKLYWKRILDSFESFSVQNSEIFTLFPILNKPKGEIEKFLFNQFNYQREVINVGLSYFEIKVGVTNKKLEKIYDFLIDNEYLNDDKVSDEGFISVLNEIETDKTITFNCSTEISSVILKELGMLFHKLTPTTIESSQRFKSKQNNTLSATNLYKSYKLAKATNSLDKQKIERFFRENL